MRAALAVSILLFSLAAMVACQTVDRSVITLCSGYALSLSTLADLRLAGKLSAPMIAAVDKERAVMNPVCLAPTLPDKLDGVTLTATAASMDAINNIIAGAK